MTLELALASTCACRLGGRSMDLDSGTADLDDSRTRLAEDKGCLADRDRKGRRGFAVAELSAVVRYAFAYAQCIA